MIRKALKSFVAIVLSFVILSPAYARANAFSDVTEGDYHYMAIQSLEEEGIINGYEDGTFRADEKVNRAEALKMLTLASGLFSEEEIESGETTDAPFDDVSDQDWYAPYIKTAVENEIVEGYEDNTFRPEQYVTLAEALKIYLESFDNLILPGVDDYLFADTPADEWFTPYTAYAAQRGMLIVHPTNEIYPQQEVSRGYLAEIIYRKKKAGEGYGFGKATYYGAAAQGSPTASGKTFDKDAFTAAHQTLPFGTIVEVTNLATGATTQVEITDRGPYGPGRVLDLSSAAFEAIAPLWQGVANVQYRVVEQ